ncbi:hypothetical protein H1R20_g4641, partial [Candolleomyces eurysporus]
MPRMALSLSDVDLTLSALPSSSTILLSMVAVFVLLSFVRAFFIGFREHLAFVKGRKAQQVPKFNSSTSASSSPSSSEKSNSTPRVQMEQRPTSSWLWGLIKWDTLPAFPLAPSLQHAHVSAGIGRGVGVGMSEKQGWLQPQAQQAALQGPVLTTRRPGGPAFERPHLPPTIITTATRKASLCPDPAPFSIGTIASSTSGESHFDTHCELVASKATITTFAIPITTFAFE